MSRYLITSSDPKTWKLDRPVIFLGEFAKPYDKRHIWSQLDATVAEPYGLSIRDRQADYNSVTRLKEFLFEEICIALNSFHNVNYEKRLWLILLGDWLTRYVDAIFNRVRTIEQCLRKHELSGASIIATQNFLVPPENSYTATNKFDDNMWNDVIFGLILKRTHPDFLLDEFVPDDQEDTTSNKTKNKKYGYRKKN